MAVDAGIWFLIIFIIIIITLIIIAIVYYKGRPTSQNETNLVNSLLHKYDLPSGWTGIQPSSDPTRNTFHLYTFPGATIPVSVNGTFFPGQPTLRSSILDNLTPGPSGATCVDVDQIMAIQEVHTCANFNSTGSTGVSLGSICYLQNGQTASIGQSETFYASQPSLPPCLGTLGDIGLNFHSTSQPPNFGCIELITGSSGPTSGDGFAYSTCDIGNQDQIFRIIRTDPGPTGPIPPVQPATTQNVTVGSSTNLGLIAKFYERRSGLCINVEGAGGGTGSIPPERTPITLGPCNDGYGGFNWMLVPPLSTGFLTGNPNSVAPQQIVYIGYLSTFPSFITEEDIVNFLVASQAKSISPFGINPTDPPPPSPNGTIVLQTYVLDETTSQGLLSTANYIDYNIAGTIVQQDPVFQNVIP